MTKAQAAQMIEQDMRKAGFGAIGHYTQGVVCVHLDRKVSKPEIETALDDAGYETLYTAEQVKDRVIVRPVVG